MLYRTLCVSLLGLTLLTSGCTAHAAGPSRRAPAPPQKQEAPAQWQAPSTADATCALLGEMMLMTTVARNKGVPLSRALGIVDQHFTAETGRDFVRAHIINMYAHPFMTPFAAQQQIEVACFQAAAAAPKVGEKQY